MNAQVVPHSGGLPKDELVGVIEGWLRADPDLKFKSVKKDAQRFLGALVTPKLFRAACDRLCLARPLRSPNRGAPNVPRESTPLMNWLVAFLTKNPEATFHEAKDAAQKAGHSFDRAIVFGLARKKCGLAPMKPRTTPPGKPGRKPKSAALDNDGSFRTSEISDLPFRQIEARFRALQAEVSRLRSALQKARAALDGI